MIRFILTVIFSIFGAIFAFECITGMNPVWNMLMLIGTMCSFMCAYVSFFFNEIAREEGWGA